MEFTQRTKKASEIHNGIDRMAEKHRTRKVTWEKSGPAEHAQAGQLSGGQKQQKSHQKVALL